MQNGWVRGNERKLDRRKSTPLEPALSLRKSDVSPLPANRFVKVTSRSTTRDTPTAPARGSGSRSPRRTATQPIWAFDHTRRRGPRGRDRLLEADALEARPPGRAGVNVPTGLPPCPGLRGEPCRDYQPFANRTATP